MVNAAFRSTWIIVAWLATVTMIVVASMAMGANLSTTAVLLALGIAPAVVIALLTSRRVGRRSYLPFGPFFILGALWAVLLRP